MNYSMYLLVGSLFAITSVSASHVSAEKSVIHKIPKPLLHGRHTKKCGYQREAATASILKVLLSKSRADFTSALAEYRLKHLMKSNPQELIASIDRYEEALDNLVLDTISRNCVEDIEVLTKVLRDSYPRNCPQELVVPLCQFISLIFMRSIARYKEQVAAQEQAFLRSCGIL